MSVVSNSEAFARVFGNGTSGNTPEERARSSMKEFVRGQTMLAEADANAQGRKLSAREALATFGFDVLRRAIDDGQAALVPDRSEPATTLRDRREELGYSVEQLARIANVKNSDVVRAETPGLVSPIRLLERLAPPLALDERVLGFKPKAGADARLGVRLRQLSRDGDTRRFSPATVAALAEAAWVIARQYSLAESIGENDLSLLGRFEPDGDYRYPTFAVGYRLAERARELLRIGQEQPIPSLRHLIENDLRIPLVETSLGRTFAGATVANGFSRGIVVNVEGANENVWVRRMTLAHELGHLLWDPTQRLDRLMIDRYDEIEGRGPLPRDPAEIRANAFAIAFLAPPAEIERTVSRATDLVSAIETITDRFGISVTAARAHVGNICGIRGPTTINRRPPDPSTEWRVREDYTNDYFPLASTPISRRGRFAWVVLRALEERVVSLDTSATLLKTSLEEIEARKSSVLEITSPESLA